MFSRFPFPRLYPLIADSFRFMSLWNLHSRVETGPRMSVICSVGFALVHSTALPLVLFAYKFHRSLYHLVCLTFLLRLFNGVNFGSISFYLPLGWDISSKFQIFREGQNFCLLFPVMGPVYMSWLLWNGGRFTLCSYLVVQ